MSSMRDYSWPANTSYLFADVTALGQNRYDRGYRLYKTERK
jgi:hypothetical protein